MSYAVVHMKKLSAPVVKGVQFHHQREKESQTNPDIDYSKSSLNYDIINSKPIDFNQEVKKVIKDNVHTDKAIRKDAVVLCDFVVTSDKEFFKGLSSQDQKKFFEKSCEFFKEKYGENKVIYAKVHMDEHTPHMHLGLVPITEEGKLSAKTLFDRKSLRSIQEDYPKHIQQHGFYLQRGEPKDNAKHLETQEYKRQRAKELSKELDKNLNNLQKRLDIVQHTKKSLYDLEHLDIKKSLIGGKITLSEGTFTDLKNLAKQGVLKSDELSKLKAENEKLKGQNNMLQDENNQMRRAITKNINTIADLRNENKNLEKGVKTLKQQGEAMVKVLKDHELIPEAQHEFKVMKEMEKIEKNVAKFKNFEMER